DARVMLATVLLAAALQVSAQSRSMRPGELVVLTIVAPADSAVRVRAFDRPIAAFAIGARRWRALVGIDLDTKPGTYQARVDTGPDTDHVVYDLVVRPRKFATRRLTVNADFVQPPPSARER